MILFLSINYTLVLTAALLIITFCILIIVLMLSTIFLIRGVPTNFIVYATTTTAHSVQ